MPDFKKLSSVVVRKMWETKYHDRIIREDEDNYIYAYIRELLSKQIPMEMNIIKNRNLKSGKVPVIYSCPYCFHYVKPTDTICTCGQKLVSVNDDSES